MKRQFNKWIYKLVVSALRIKEQIDLLEKKKLVTLGSESVLYPESRIFNFPGDPRSIRIGKGTHIRGELMICPYGGDLQIGDNSFIGEYSKVWAGESITIGNNVLISHNVNIIDTNSHEMDEMERAASFYKMVRKGHTSEKGQVLTSPIIIDDYAWISFNVIILKGVHIGKGAIVAAGSVVTKNVDDFTIVAGNPATVVKRLKANKE